MTNPSTKEINEEASEAHEQEITFSMNDIDELTLNCGDLEKEYFEMLNDIGLMQNNLSQEGKDSEYMLSTLEKTNQDLVASLKGAVNIEQQSKALLCNHSSDIHPVAA